MRLSVRLTIVFGVLSLVTIATVASLAYWLAAAEVRESVDNELVQRLRPLGSAATTEAPGRVVTQFDGDPIAAGEIDPENVPFLGDPEQLSSIGDTTRFQVAFDDGTILG